MGQDSERTMCYVNSGMSIAVSVIIISIALMDEIPPRAKVFVGFVACMLLITSIYKVSLLIVHWYRHLTQSNHPSV
jgi:hypothetical protein